MSFYSTKNKTNPISEHEEKAPYAEARHVAGVEVPVISDSNVSGKPVNALLLMACFAFGASSFLFGFDDKLISPLVALEPFVSHLLQFNALSISPVFSRD